MVAHVLDMKFDDVPMTSFSYTVQRNWGLTEDLLNSKRWCDHKGPWVADLMQSPSRGAYVSMAVPTITKAHAPNNAYWLVVLDGQQSETSARRVYKKRPLMLKDLFLAQGWAAGAAAVRFKDIPEKAMLAALGNAMSLNVMKALWTNLKPVLEALNEHDIEVSAK